MSDAQVAGFVALGAALTAACAFWSGIRSDDNKRHYAWPMIIPATYISPAVLKLWFLAMLWAVG